MITYYRHTATGDILLLTTEARRSAQMPATRYSPDRSRKRRKIRTSAEALARDYARIPAIEVPEGIRA